MDLPVRNKMPTNDFEMDFVLVRGPALLDRRLHVRLPRNGTPITIGRATHCTTLLDPSLLFSSQVQCSLFAVPAKAPASLPPFAPSSANAAATTAITTPTRPRATDSLQGAETPSAGAPDNGVTPAHQSTHVDSIDSSNENTMRACFKVYITDLCSSNGTFVNGLRISGTDPTELQQGDVCIFGGMRDVEEGDVLPADAYAGPELILWRVDFGLEKENSAHAFDFTATPLVLPVKDVLEAEVRALMETAKQSLPKPPRSSQAGRYSATPAAQKFVDWATSITSTAAAVGPTGSCVGASGSLERGDDSPRGVPQQLFTSPAPRAAKNGSEDGKDDEEDRVSELTLVSNRNKSSDTDGGEGLKDSEDRRSVPLVAATTPGAEGASTSFSDDTPIPAEPPRAVYYTAVRLGNVIFRAANGKADLDENQNKASATADDEEPTTKRTRTELDAAMKTVVDPLPLLTCTNAHIKWTMLNPNELLNQQKQQQEEGRQLELTDMNDGAKKLHKKPFYGMLAVTTLATVVACVERCGLAVELKDGCQLPLVDAAVINGSAESRWAAWTLDAGMPEAVPEAVTGVADSAIGSSNGGGTSAKKNVSGRGGRKVALAKTKESETKAAEEKEEATEVTMMLKTPAERFEAWLRHFELFYGNQGVPAPHLVDAATFDLIFAPPPSPFADGKQE